MQKESTINHKQTVEQMILIFQMSNDSRLIFHGDIDMDDLGTVDETIRLNEAINYVAELFNTTQIQSCLMSIIFGFQMNNYEINFEKLLNYLNLELPNYFDLQTEIQELIDKRIIKYKREINTKNLYNSIFSVNPKVIDALYNNRSIEEGLSEPEVSFIQFCGHISRIIRSYSDRRLSMFDLSDEVYKIETWNQNLVAIQSLKELKVNIEDRILLYSLIESLTSDNESLVNLSILIKRIFGASNYPFIINTFLKGEHDLQRKGLIMVDSKTKGLVEDMTIGLTTKAMTILLGDSASFYVTPRSTDHHCICCENLVSKPFTLSKIKKSFNKLMSRFGWE